MKRYIISSGGRSGTHLLHFGILRNIPYDTINVYNIREPKNKYEETFTHNKVQVFSNFELLFSTNYTSDCIPDNDSFVFLLRRKDVVDQILSRQIASYLMVKNIIINKKDNNYTYLYKKQRHEKGIEASPCKFIVKDNIEKIQLDALKNYKLDDKEFIKDIKFMQERYYKVIFSIKTRNIPYKLIYFEDLVKNYSTILKECLDIMNLELIDTSDPTICLKKEIYSSELNDYITELHDSFLERHPEFSVDNMN